MVDDKDKREGTPQDGQGEGNQGGQPPAQESTPMVALSMDEYDAMQNELEQAKTKAGEYQDGWQRERADFINFKRRVESQSQQMQQNALANVVRKYLVVLDDLERALKMRPTGEEGAAWANGIELIYRKLQNLLEQEGVTRMDAEHEAFDPNRHEALSLEESPEHASGDIIEVVQPGYLLGDRVIRPALVRVAK